MEILLTSWKNATTDGLLVRTHHSFFLVVYRGKGERWWDMPKAVLFAQRAISQRLQKCWASHSQGSVNVTEWNLKPS